MKSVKDLIDLAKAKPGQINYGSAGIGSGTHINGEQFKLAAGINVVHVPFKGTPEALTNVIGGSVSVFLLADHRRGDAGQRRQDHGAGGLDEEPLAGAARSADASPRSASPVSISICGPGFLGPAKMPKDVKDKLEPRDRAHPRFAGRQRAHADAGCDAAPMSPAEFDAFIKAEVERLAKVVKASGARAD